MARGDSAPTSVVPSGSGLQGPVSWPIQLQPNPQAELLPPEVPLCRQPRGKPGMAPAHPAVASLRHAPDWCCKEKVPGQQGSSPPPSEQGLRLERPPCLEALISDPLGGWTTYLDYTLPPSPKPPPHQPPLGRGNKAEFKGSGQTAVSPGSAVCSWVFWPQFPTL